MANVIATMEADPGRGLIRQQPFYMSITHYFEDDAYLLPVLRPKLASAAMIDFLLTDAELGCSARQSVCVDEIDPKMTLRVPVHVTPP